MQAFGVKKGATPGAPGAPKSGMEGMLRALGMGEFLDAIQTMATPQNVATLKALLDSGTVEKLQQLADLAPVMVEMNERLSRIERSLGEPFDGTDGGGSDEPGPRADDGGPVGLPDRHAGRVSEPVRSHRRSSRQRPASAAVDDGAESGAGAD